MNIKIKDSIPETDVIVTIPFGSQVYGTATETSDKDFVKLIKSNTGDLVLQYKQVGDLDNPEIDYIYVDEFAFLKKIKNGDSTVFFECMHTKEFQNYFPANNVLYYYTSKVAKAYLGLAKRDLKYPNRTHHVIRCIWMAKKIINKEIINLSEVANLPKTMNMTNEQLLLYISELRTGLKYESHVTT